MSVTTADNTTAVEAKVLLPPLILHPFADAAAPGQLIECSRASLALQGLTPTEDWDVEELTRRVLDGRYCELKMLCYVGKDLMRWIEQCVEFSRRNQDSFPEGVNERSFAALLTEKAPAKVREKLRLWGVLDYRALFVRALGLNVIFNQPPGQESLSAEFLRNFHGHAESIFFLHQQQKPFTCISSASFSFEIYASAEYSKMLEQAWEQ